MDAENFDFPLDNPDVEPQGDLVREKLDEDYRFPDKHKEDFVGLNYLGALHDEFDFVGHHIVIRTLNADETLAVSQLIKPYEGSQGFMRAYVTAMVACSVVSVDGEQLVVPLGDLGDNHNNSYNLAKQRFNYVKARWYPPTLDAIYAKYLALEDRVNDILASMGKASG